MKLEFIKNINDYDEHAVRLSDFNSSQALLFRDTIRKLIASPEVSIDLATLDFIEPVNCTLILRTGLEDVGISLTDRVIFVCELTLDAYRNMLLLLEPFCRKESKGYQWLYELDMPIGFLFSSGSDLPDKD